MRVAVVRNNRQGGVLARFGEASLEAGLDDAAALVVAALRDEGHTTVACEGDMRLPEALRRFMPPTGTGDPRGFVVNLSRGLQGECARCHVPAMLELCGIPYTGPGPVTLALTCDVAMTRSLLERAGVPTLRFAIMRTPGSEAAGLRFPLVVRPRRERPGFAPVIAPSPSHLAEAVERVATACQQESLVEERVDSMGVAASLIGNARVESLPLLVESDGGERTRLLGRSLDARVRPQVAAIAAAAFEACGCRDHAVIRLALDRDGNALVSSVDPSPRLTLRSVFVQAAVAAGYTYAALVARILDAAHERYFGVVAPRFEIAHGPMPRVSHGLLTAEPF
jgi:D-alanine-D-alanine ligase